METRINRRCFVNNCLWKQFFASDSTQTPSNLIFMTILVPPRHLPQFQFKISGINLQLSAQMCLTW